MTLAERFLCAIPLAYNPWNADHPVPLLLFFDLIHPSTWVVLSLLSGRCLLRPCLLLVLMTLYWSSLSASSFLAAVFLLGCIVTSRGVCVCSTMCTSGCCSQSDSAMALSCPLAPTLPWLLEGHPPHLKKSWVQGRGTVLTIPMVGREQLLSGKWTLEGTAVSWQRALHWVSQRRRKGGGKEGIQMWGACRKGGDHQKRRWERKAQWKLSALRESCGGVATGDETREGALWTLHLALPGGGKWCGAWGEEDRELS